MGLNDTYAAVKRKILMMSPLTSMNHAYALLMQDEKQREVYVSSKFPGESASFLAGNQNTFNQRAGNYEAKGRKNNLVFNQRAGNYGHTVDKCYRIVGFPNDFKFTKGKKFQGNARSNAVFSTEKEQGHGSNTLDVGCRGQPITQEQYSQLM